MKIGKKSSCHSGVKKVTSGACSVGS